MENCLKITLKLFSYNDKIAKIKNEIFFTIEK